MKVYATLTQHDVWCVYAYSASGCPIANRHRSHRPAQTLTNGTQEPASTILNRPLGFKMDTWVSLVITWILHFLSSRKF